MTGNHNNWWIATLSKGDGSTLNMFQTSVQNMFTGNLDSPFFTGGAGMGPILSSPTKIYITFADKQKKFLSLMRWSKTYADVAEASALFNCKATHIASYCEGYSLAYLASRDAVVIGATLVD